MDPMTRVVMLFIFGALFMIGIGIVGFGVSMLMEKQGGGESMYGAIAAIMAEAVIFVGVLLSGISAGVAYATAKKEPGHSGSGR